MPIPEKTLKAGYRGVEIRQTEKLGFFVVLMSHNKHRFGTMEEARTFVDQAIDAERGRVSEFYRRFGVAA